MNAAIDLKVVGENTDYAVFVRRSDCSASRQPGG
jgi:hypothetical protein